MGMIEKTDDEKKNSDNFSILTNALAAMPNDAIEKGRRFLL